VLLCGGNYQILEETILYAALDVFAKCLGSKILERSTTEVEQGWGENACGRLGDGGEHLERIARRTSSRVGTEDG
jgi:hypothetical protein